ncbi:uncharacterized protein LOC100180805 [Ciona intestinalis]
MCSSWLGSFVYRLSNVRTSYPDVGSCIFILLGVVIGLVGLCSDRNKCCMVTEGVLTIVGGIVALCACAVYTGLNHNGVINFGYSFYFGWVSGVGYIVAGALHAAGSK